MDGGQATIAGPARADDIVGVSNAGTLSTQGVQGHGFFMISGPVSLWTNDGDFVLEGAPGLQQLSISDSGRLTNTGDLTVAQGASTNVIVSVFGDGLLGSRNGVIGAGAGSRGEVDVGGAGSQWSNTGDVTVGGQGFGTLRINGDFAGRPPSPT